MFCPNCGSQVSEGERFCSKCGNALEGTKTGNKENTGYSAGIAEAMGNPGAMAGKKPAEKGKKEKKLGKWGWIILASVGIVVFIAIIGIVVWWMNPERRLNRKIDAARKSGATSLDLSSFDTSSVDNMTGMFATCSSLEELDLSSFDTSSVTTMEGMFTGCTSLKELDLSSFDTSSVTDMRSMFGDYVFFGCRSLEELDLSSFDTSSVTEMGQMFSDCSSLKELDLSSFDTSSVKDMHDMFSGCSSLKELDLSSFDTSSVDSMSSMFDYCKNLQTVYLGDGWTDEWIEYVKDEYPDINFIMK